jgi:prevent-host-death family protein
MTMKDDQEAWMAEQTQQITAAEFKAKCLRLMDEVAKRRAPLVITKRGKPIAKLVPVDDQPIDPFGCMAGTIKIVGNIVDPIDDLEWTGDADNV